MTTNSPRRIGYILTAVWEGGLERFTGELIDAMDRTEFAPHLYVLTNKNPWLGEFERRNIPITVFNASNTPSFTSVPSTSKTFFELARALKRDQIELIHTCDFFPAAVGRLASRVAGTPRRLHTLHSLYDWYPKWAHILNRWLSHSTNLITAVSNSVAQAAQLSENIPTEKMRVILNGADIHRFQPYPEEGLKLRLELGFSPDDILVGSIGSLTTRKAHHLLVEAISPLMQSNPRLKLVVFGANNGGPQDNHPQVLRSIQSSQVSDRIHILAPRTDVERVYSAFDVFCMPSLVEGLSLAAVEAQLCGSLSVFSDIGPFQEVVTDGRNGFLFRSGNTASLQETLAKALAILPNSGQIREMARLDAIRRFDKNRMVASYLDTYRSLLLKEPA